MRVTLCAACGRLILRSFAFCPYCGERSREALADLEVVLESPFARLAELAGQEQTALRPDAEDAVSKRIALLIAELDELDAEIETLEAFDSARP